MDSRTRRIERAQLRKCPLQLFGRRAPSRDSSPHRSHLLHQPLPLLLHPPAALSLLVRPLPSRPLRRSLSGSRLRQTRKPPLPLLPHLLTEALRLALLIQLRRHRNPLYALALDALRLHAPGLPAPLRPAPLKHVQSHVHIP
jgi:hypothetical protein